MQVTEEMVNVPPGGDEAPMNQLDPMDAPIPGQSLTNSPENSYPWEQPPVLTDVKEASMFFFSKLIILTKELVTAAV